MNQLEMNKTTLRKNNSSTALRDKSQNTKPVANVLIIDDDQEAIRLILEVLARKEIRANLANDEKTATAFLGKNDCDMVFFSIQTSQQLQLSAQLQDGFKLLEAIKTNSPEMPVIMMTQASCKTRKGQNQQQIVETAVGAIRFGCCDFLIKPLRSEKIERLLDTFLPNHSINNVDYAERDSQTLYRLVGKSLKLARTVELAKKVAPTSVPVLINGESGTGKELISYLIYYYSKRANGPYIRVNCAALSDSLLESELFGHEKGAFTGAHVQRKGRFELAHGGTLLLDEITETPRKFQAKLLRVLEQQDFERVGGSDSIKVDVRIISTTNKDMSQEVMEGRFRQDLYYRLSGVKLIVPPLRERPEDLVDLVWHFVNLNAHQGQRRITKLDPAMMDIFAKYHWPGNIRQLRNVVLTSLILGAGETLSLADVSWLFDELQPLPQENKISTLNCQSPDLDIVGLPLEQIERQAILGTLDQTGGNQTKAAEILGITDRTLRTKIQRYRRQDTLQLA